MLQREKPTIPQILWQRLQEMLQIKPYNSKTMEPQVVRYTAPTIRATERR